MNAEKETAPNGELYDGDDPELVAERQRAELTRRYSRTAAGDGGERRNC